MIWLIGGKVRVWILVVGFRGFGFNYCVVFCLLCNENGVYKVFCVGLVF